MTDEQIDPAEALALAQQTRRRVAERGQAWWYHVAYGVALAIMTTGLASPSPGVASAVGLAIIFGSMAVQRRRSGIGHIRHGRRTRALAIAAGALLAAGWVTVLLAYERFGVAWAPLVGGPLLGLAAALASWMIDRAWRAEGLGE